MKTSIPKIVNVKYKNVITNENFAKNGLQLEMKQCIDTLCNDIGSLPTGYYIAVFGTDTNRNMARAYNFTPECPIGIWDALGIIKSSH